LQPFSDGCAQLSLLGIAEWTSQTARHVLVLSREQIDTPATDSKGTFYETSTQKIHAKIEKLQQE
jgi:hypothetical protein